MTKERKEKSGKSGKEVNDQQRNEVTLYRKHPQKEDKEKKIYVPLGKEIYRELKTHPIHHVVCTDQPKNAPGNQTE